MNKFKEILTLLENDIFKPASPEDAIKRKQEYALIQINKILKEKGHQNSDGSWDINGDVDISRLGLTEIPVKFNKVSGYFVCSHNNLTSLKGAPEVVGYSFYCSHNNLTSLKGAPNYVGGVFYCSNNKLTSLKGAPKEVEYNFYCYNNSVKFAKEDVLKHCNVKGSINTL